MEKVLGICLFGGGSKWSFGNLGSDIPSSHQDRTLKLLPVRNSPQPSGSGLNQQFPVPDLSLRVSHAQLIPRAVIQQEMGLISMEILQQLNLGCLILISAGPHFQGMFAH